MHNVKQKKSMYPKGAVFPTANLREPPYAKQKNVYDHLVSPSSVTAYGGATFPREGEGSNTGTCLTAQ